MVHEIREELRGIREEEDSLALSQKPEAVGKHTGSSVQGKPISVSSCKPKAI